MEEIRLHSVKINEKEQIFLDGVEVRNVASYELKHSADVNEPARLTLSLYVDVDLIGSDIDLEKELVVEEEFSVDSLVDQIGKEMSKIMTIPDDTTAKTEVKEKTCMRLARTDSYAVLEDGAMAPTGFKLIRPEEEDKVKEILEIVDGMSVMEAQSLLRRTSEYLLRTAVKYGNYMEPAEPLSFKELLGEEV